MIECGPSALALQADDVLCGRSKSDHCGPTTRFTLQTKTCTVSESQPRRKRDSTDDLNEVLGQKYSRTSPIEHTTRSELWVHTTAHNDAGRPNSEGPKTPLFLPILGHRHPVCVSSLETLYVELRHVAQVLLEPLIQGSLIFLKRPTHQFL
jgi:hypothetical protein